MNKNLKLLAITSLPTVGNAGLKNMGMILGGNYIPIPTLIASGLGNMKGHQKITVDFHQTLQSSLKIVREYNLELIVYIGYLADASQITIIRDALDANKDIIKSIVVDPVCGDNNKPYVNEEIIQNFHQLIELADFVLPNETELRLLTNTDFESSFETIVQQFRTKYPRVNLVVKSVNSDETHKNYLFTESERHECFFQKIPMDFSGSGDLFAAIFIQYHFFYKYVLKETFELTTSYLQQIIAFNCYYKNQKHDIVLPAFNTNLQEKGALFYVVGPSGVGKDTLLNFAKKQLIGSNVIFITRYITRPKQSDAEDYFPMTKEEFRTKISQDHFALWWDSHNNLYGITAKIDMLLNNGFNVVVSGSRGYFNTAIQRYPKMKTVLITADNHLIRERLVKRGRESKDEIEKRIERSKAFNDGLFKGSDVIKIQNNDSIDQVGNALVKVLSGSFPVERNEKSLVLFE